MNFQIYTLGFSKKSLRQFVDFLQEGNINRLIDTRLNNTSQLSGFSKKGDLEYIMELVNIDYRHDVSLAPTEEILTSYKKKAITWGEYEKHYIELLYKRKIETRIPEILEDKRVCFLCSEDKPHHCHRRLLAEYIQNHIDKKVDIVHLF
ncbi:DUF488 domain-containing protein [Aneurinibacillus tyrosinisolvens]|uniref:DUF488 domain-containing protein n=1 Tax=Aneurinibacillus tyrosinisolvens TaxID=1443435 RepID=UPI00063F70C8|nr:DUF488 domain-containing protein [Aneurinibacillus tyrosinisolvens]